MSSDCERSIVQVLGTRQAPGNPGGRAWGDVAQELADLPEACQSVLLRHVGTLLSAGFADEGELLVALFGACRSGATRPLADLLRQAAQSPRTSFKEDYAGLLDDLFGEESGGDALAQVVAAAAAGEPRPDVAATLQALLSMRSRAAVRFARELLSGASSEVRDAAASYLYNLDDSDSADAFLERLEDETDPHTAGVLTDGLVRWDHRAAAPRLRALARDEQRPREVRDVLVRAADDLEQG